MKYKFIKGLLGTAFFAFLLMGCSDVLEENPRSIYEPSFFKTERGVESGITALYAQLRYVYGQGYFYNACLTGTDEVTYAQSADGNFKDMDLSGAGSLTSTSSRADVLWGNAFTSINTANGIIENAEEVESISDALVAEAHFFRAFNYFMLVQTFGGVPLDLGAGELAFNTSTSRYSKRNTVSEVYSKVIFPDLLTAVENLPVDQRVTGGVTKTVARLFLSKAYLTYGWWLENPKNIPTYPETDRNDPDGHDAQWYFQQAYDVATFAIENPGPYGLQPTFYDVNLAQNDRNSEILLYADHTEDSEYYNGGSLTYGSGGAPDNFAVWFMTWNYINTKSGADPNWNERISPVLREAAQPLGRPWTRMCPTIEVVTETFAEKTLDSRFDGTFTTVYRANWPKGGTDLDVVYNANNMTVSPGEPILTFLEEEPAVEVDYSNDPYNSDIGAGVIPGRADYVIPPSGISRLRYPGLWKLGVYRTDNNGGLGQPNAGSTRPFNIAKFSEFYFIAAEAAVKGAATTAGMTARDLINVIRGRAGNWRWDNNGNAPKNEDFSQEMMDATPVDVDVEYILAERSREYYGEGYRWYDLVRTQMWRELSSEYTIGSASLNEQGDEPDVFTREIQDFHYLRPIPQGQLDAMEMDEAEKAAYQNPGYN